MRTLLYSGVCRQHTRSLAAHARPFAPRNSRNNLILLNTSHLSRPLVHVSHFRLPRSHPDKSGVGYAEKATEG